MTRSIIKDLKNENHINFDCNYGYNIVDIDRKTQKLFDKSITILKIATQKLGLIISEAEENWIIHEILMQHKSILDNEIDLLIKQKKKL